MRIGGMIPLGRLNMLILGEKQSCYLPRPAGAYKSINSAVSKDGSISSYISCIRVEIDSLEDLKSPLELLSAEREITCARAERTRQMSIWRPELLGRRRQ